MSAQTIPAFDPNRKPIPKSEIPAPPRETLAGAPSLLPLGPWRVKVSKHTWGEYNQILQFVKDRTPQPLKEFRQRLDLLTGHQAAQDKLVADFLDVVYIADREWPPDFCSTPFLKVVFSPEHMGDVLRMALGRLNPELVGAIAAYADSLHHLEEEEMMAAVKQFEAIVERWLMGSLPETRESIRGAIDPKGDGGEAHPAGTPPPASESIATSQRNSADSPTKSTD